ncbi:hypothetical protein [uncultured Algimonas sp.]|uniref:hypothetical protein n=1 Tax=uncultured Algimonas sp. TaxID=1547920 RepID=UPI002631CB60|nr:hypothetical protein [uncultured Algimonas sp.]
MSVDMANGDNIGQLDPWQWPDAFSDMTVDDTNAMLDALAITPRRASDQSPDWAGHVVADHLGLSMDDKHARSRFKTMLKTWLANGVIRTVHLDDGKRNKRPHIEVTGKHRA